jgi:hypothetical protein
VFGAWRYYQYNGDKKKLQMLEDHFVLSLRNIDEGRYHTIFTNMFGCGNNLLAFAVAQVMPILLYGGNLSRNVGIGPTAFIYVAGQLVMNAAGAFLNSYQRDSVRELKTQLYAGEDLYTLGSGPGSIKSEKRKYVRAMERMDATVTTPLPLETRLRQVLRMSDAEFIDAADKRYSMRGVPGVGGGLLLAAAALRLHPLGLLPLPFLPLPVLTLAPLTFVSLWSAHREYLVQEMSVVMGPVFALGIIMGSMISRRGVPFREMPESFMVRLRMTKWLLKTRNSAEYAQPAPSPVVPGVNPNVPRPTPEQLELMRRRNERFQKKQQNQQQQQQKQKSSQQNTTDPTTQR